MFAKAAGNKMNWIDSAIAQFPGLTPMIALILSVMACLGWETAQCSR